MSQQLFLPTISEDDIWYRWLAEIDAIVSAFGKKQASARLGFGAPSDPTGQAMLSNCLAERARCEFKLRQLPVLLGMRRDDRLLEAIVEPFGHALYPRREMTPEEKCERYEAALSRAGAAGAAIREDALGRYR